MESEDNNQGLIKEAIFVSNESILNFTNSVVFGFKDLLMLKDFSILEEFEQKNPENNSVESLQFENAKTAYEVYSIDEEYQLLEHLKLNPKMQMLSIIDGQYFDILQVGEKQIYFKLISKPKAQII